MDDEISTHLYYTRNLIKKECMVCFTELRCEIVYGTYASIQDLEIIRDDRLFISCCLKADHFICKPCLKKMSLNFSNHMINKTRSHMYCPFMGGCLNEDGGDNYFRHADIKKVLLPDDFLLYSEHARRFQNPGFETVKCKECFYSIFVKEEDIQSSGIGDLIIICGNFYCSSKFCYTCKQSIDSFHTSCRSCESKEENLNPHAFNKYFYKPLEYRSSSLHGQENYFFRNSELNTEIILEQISEIILNEYVRCPVCVVKMYKTEQCNGMGHCSSEVCYVCNRKSTGNLTDHWSETGRKGCFRFETSPILKYIIPEYECIEGYCFGHELGDCKTPAHKLGIEKMSKFRKRNIVYHMLKSLLPFDRDSITRLVVEHDDYNYIEEYLALDYDCKNYFDYLPPATLELYNRFELLSSPEPEITPLIQPQRRIAPPVFDLVALQERELEEFTNAIMAPINTVDTFTPEFEELRRWLIFNGYSRIPDGEDSSDDEDVHWEDIV